MCVCVHPNNVNLTHNGSTRVSMISVLWWRCMEIVLGKLFFSFMRNDEVKLNEVPLFSFSFLKTVFIYL